MMTVPVPSLVIFVSAVSVLSCGQTDRQTDRHAVTSRITDKITDTDECYTRATTVGMIKPGFHY